MKSCAFGMGLVDVTELIHTKSIQLTKSTFFSSVNTSPPPYTLINDDPVYDASIGREGQSLAIGNE